MCTAITEFRNVLLSATSHIGAARRLLHMYAANAGALGILYVFLTLGYAHVALAQPYVGTINLELDYMVADDHSHIPDPSTIAALVQMFACQNLLLNIVVSDTIHEPLDGNSWYVFEDPEIPHSRNYYRARYFNHEGQANWKYGVMVHYIADEGYEGADGIAIPDEVTFFVRWNRYSDYFRQAALIAHEFGHSLGLHHGGLTDETKKPNYPSVMSYRYYTDQGVNQRFVCDGFANSQCPDFKRLDYSHGTLPDLNPASLDESSGMGYGPIDWNCNGIIDGGTVSVNILAQLYCGSGAGQFRTLTDHDDWTYLRTKFSYAAVARMSATAPGAASELQSVNIIECEYQESSVEVAPTTNPISNCFVTPPLTVDIEPCNYPYEGDSDSDGLDDYCDVCPFQVANTCCCNYPGDADDDGNVFYPDRDYLVAYLYQSGAAPPCYDEGDANGNSSVNVADVIYLNNYFLYFASEPKCGLTGN